MPFPQFYPLKNLKIASQNCRKFVIITLKKYENAMFCSPPNATDTPENENREDFPPMNRFFTGTVSGDDKFPADVI